MEPLVSNVKTRVKPLENKAKLSILVKIRIREFTLQTDGKTITIIPSDILSNMADYTYIFRVLNVSLIAGF